MPGTTRYSATFDRPYEEEERAGPAARRSRSQSWQANSGLDGRPYTPLVNNRPSPRSSSTDGGPSNVEHIPTRTVVKTAVKAHNNPFQFVKVGTCPLYKKAEEQLKKAKEVKKPEVLKEEEEWQSNLDSWKSRRRKMSEDVFRRQEEIRQLELEEQLPQANQKKIKTFSEMVESRAHRGRTLSLCLMSSPLELQDWELEKNKHDSNGRFSGESEENSNVNSEDEEVGFKGTLQSTEQKMFPDASKRTNGEAHSANNNATSNSHNNGYNKFSEMETSHITQKEGLFIDSGLESISSSHRAGDTPDSGSDFSQDSGSSIDCDSPRVSGLTLNGVSLEEYNSKLFQKSFGLEMTVKLCLKSKNDDFGFAFCGGKTEGEFFIASVSDRSLAQSCGIRTDDQILAINGENVESKEHVEFVALLEKAKVKGCLEMLLRRPEKCTDIATQSHSVENDNKAQNGESVNVCIDRSDASNTKNLTSATNCVKLKNSSYSDLVQEPNGLQQKSIESENEMYVDDFEELEKHSKSSFPSITQSEAKPLVNTQPQENGFHSSLKSAADPITAEDSLSVNEKKSEHTNLLNDMKIKDEIKALGEKPVAFNAPKIKPEPVCLNEKIKPLVNQKKKSKTSKKVMNSKKSGENSDQKKNLIFNSKEVNNGNMNEDSLNIIFQSPNEMVKKSTHPLNRDKTNSLCSNEQTAQLTLKDDIPPIEKIAEEMEKMILEQLEEEERAKEMAAEVQAKSSSESTEHFLTAPPRLVEPPKEKPPPPPSTPVDGQKASSLKRVNSTKRIKKEIHKRRSNFLGIENADENVVPDETSIPPPPALEEILKAEMELDRESRRKLENATSERLILEERDIIEKEREIIECLETEERQKNLVKNSEDFKDHRSTFVEHCDITCEEDRIQILKEERKRMEEERVLNEEQRLMLTEEKQLREREEYIRKQEADHCSPAELSTSLLSVPANLSNSPKSPNASSLSAENMPNISFSATSGEGEKILSNSAPQLTDQKGNGNEEKSNMPAKPVVPPKPLKKKEAIRKERERLRQEQEALQREREEHRRKLMIEQEELMNSHQKPHGTLAKKFFTVAVVLTVIPLSLYYLFSCVPKMHA